MELILLGEPPEEGPPFSGMGHNLVPMLRPLEPPCLAPRQDAEDLSGLSSAVTNTITQSGAPSMRQAYALKWSLFANWCAFSQKTHRDAQSGQCFPSCRRGWRADHPPRSLLLPSMNLSVVLLGLQRAPFEPLELVRLRALSLKTALLKVLTSNNRVGDLQAFSAKHALSLVWHTLT